MPSRFGCLVCIVAMSALSLSAAGARAQATGIFEGQSDVGSVNPPGAAQYDLNSGVYTITSLCGRGRRATWR